MQVPALVHNASSYLIYPVVWLTVGTPLDFTTSFLHSSRFSAFRSMVFHSRPVHSLLLFSHRFLYLPLRLPPWTVPCSIVLASSDDHETCPDHFSLRLFKKSGLHTAQWRFHFWLSLPHWLYDLCMRYREVCRNITSPMPVSFFQCLLLWSTFHMHTKMWAWPGNASVWSWSWWWCSCCSRWLLVWSLQLWSGLSWCTVHLNCRVSQFTGPCFLYAEGLFYALHHENIHVFRCQQENSCLISLAHELLPELDLELQVCTM